MKINKDGKTAPISKKVSLMLCNPKQYNRIIQRNKCNTKINNKINKMCNKSSKIINKILKRIIESPSIKKSSINNI